MLHLIPQVKKLIRNEGFLPEKSVCYDEALYSKRIAKALSRLPFGKEGVPLKITIDGDGGEEYELTVCEDLISIKASGEAGAFYGIQTLRQLFAHDTVPCLHIEDAPDFEYRGFYHDMTRGKVATVETLKKLIDLLAYCKMNSLQLYIEHTYEFRGLSELNEKAGYISKEELMELDAYCRENFIDFIPSLATFGHMYEILEVDEYKHLRTLSSFEAGDNRWDERMAHHTIDPEDPESIELVKSLIDQYSEAFTSDTFNICGDETFDLRYHKSKKDPGELYVGFVNKIISHVTEMGKRVMMWADIVLAHPETIDIIPEETVFLNWNYASDPWSGGIERLAALGKKQIVCPGTGTWSRLAESADNSESNIAKMTKYGKENGALGVLNTNWGDWGNPCSLELSLYCTVFGAERSWSASTEPDESFRENIDYLVYGETGTADLVKAVSRLHDRVNWNRFCAAYFEHRRTGKSSYEITEARIDEITEEYKRIEKLLSEKTWRHDSVRRELLLAAEGTALMAELAGVMAGLKFDRVTDTVAWCDRFSERWLCNNKPSELYRIRDMFLYLANI